MHHVRKTKSARLVQVATNPVGLVVALLAVCCTAVYQIWAGAKQKELGAGSMQLMHQFAPHATGLLAGLVVGVEPLGLPGSPGGGRASRDSPVVSLHIAREAVCTCQGMRLAHQFAPPRPLTGRPGARSLLAPVQ